MKDKIANIDRLLARVMVNGDNLILIAQARSLLKQVYDEVQYGKDLCKENQSGSDETC